jgi:hypothetical protein
MHWASFCRILGVVFCRVFLNRQTAVAHAYVFDAIEEIVKEDTGRFLRWRHIHASDLDETDGMILQWTGDQHGGQAKGICYLNHQYASLCD